MVLTATLSTNFSMAKQQESYLPEPTPDRQLVSPSGWCITEHHNNCPYQFRHGRCGCECHGKDQRGT